MENKELQAIEEKFGENFSILCNEAFGKYMKQEENVVFSLIDRTFYENKYLYEDLKESNLISYFLKYLHSKLENSSKEESVSHLFEEVGYDFFPCEEYKEIKKFEKYYEESETPADIFDENAFKGYKCFFAISKDIKQIKRKDIVLPQIQDKYATSVLLIQFSNNRWHTLRIVNRYNNKYSPKFEKTFHNNLENINVGLTKAFSREFNQKDVDEPSIYEVGNFIRAKDGKFYKYNCKINGVYFCPNNIVIDNLEVRKYEYDYEKYLLFDYFILDNTWDTRLLTYDPDNIHCKNFKLLSETAVSHKGESTIYMNNRIYTDRNYRIYDGLINMCMGLRKTTVKQEKEYKLIFIEEEAIIKLDKDNRIIEYTNQTAEWISPNFLSYNDSIKKISLPQAKEIQSGFLKNNTTVSFIDAPNLLELGKDSLLLNPKMRQTLLETIKKNKKDAKKKIKKYDSQ